MSDQEAQEIIVIKRPKKGGGGHHGGAWKVAYADFVTAMMAFFLLLWLLNVTTDEQRNAISNYFDPTHPKISESTSGSGGLLGGLSAAPEGAMVTEVQPLTQNNPSGSVAAGQQVQSQPTVTPQQQAAKQAEEARFKEAEESIKQALEDIPELKEMAENLIVDMTPEGLRIQIVDREGQSMFPIGSTQMYEKTKQLLGMVAHIVAELPNELSVRGHTDSAPYGKNAAYTNWELSSDRANAARRVFEENGIEPDRVNNVVGKADSEHFNKEDPLDPRNRRLSIILLKDEIVHPPPPAPAGTPTAPAGNMNSDGLPGPSAPPHVGTFRKSPGQVEFP